MDLEETLQNKSDLILKVVFFTFPIEIISDSVWLIIQLLGKRCNLYELFFPDLHLNTLIPCFDFDL